MFSNSKIIYIGVLSSGELRRVSEQGRIHDGYPSILTTVVFSICCVFSLN